MKIHDILVNCRSVQYETLIIIFDENKEVFSLDQFLNEEIADYLYNTDGKLYDCVELLPSYYFISDGLRFSKSEDFR